MSDQGIETSRRKEKKTMLLLNNATLFRFNHYGLTTNEFSTGIARGLSKINRFSIGRSAKFVGHVR